MLMLIQNFCIDFVKVPEVSELQKLVGTEIFIKQ
jgi:hypothetical protein